MHRRPLVLASAAMLLAAFGAASAQNAFTSRPMNVRAGPNRGYPLVAQLGPGAPLDVHGCLSDWSWCDVSFDGSRGWIYARGLSFVYRGERVPLYSYGPSLGLSIITFSLMGYWNQYYRGRPWYSQRNSWAHRRLPPHMRPPGRPHAGPPATSTQSRRPPHGRQPMPMQGRRPPRGRQPMQHTPQAQRPQHGQPGAREEGHGRSTPPRRPGGQRPGGAHARPAHPPGSRGSSDQREHRDGGSLGAPRSARL